MHKTVSSRHEILFPVTSPSLKVADAAAAVIIDYRSAWDDNDTLKNTPEDYLYSSDFS